MAYDQELAEQIHNLIGDDPDLTEMKMFGGLAFLINGNMAVAATSQGGFMVRTNPAYAEKILRSSKARLMNMKGRTMPGWILVNAEDIYDQKVLKHWVDLGVTYARSLPPKNQS
jgi:TfoX/Sxy family transcriptional regulator of competence genes